MSMVVSSASVAGFAALLADRTRAGMCLALMDGRAWTLGELARHCGVTRSTASEHATALVSAGLLGEERQGRHRYLRLADEDVATLVEELTAAVGYAGPVPSSLRGVRVAGELARARTCYDHLAGLLGVTLLDALVDRGFISRRDGLTLTPAGRDWFVVLAGEAALRPRGSRVLVRTCLDWTERRHHLGGALGAVLHGRLVDRGWVVPTAHPRAVRLTVEGAGALTQQLGHDFGSLMTERSATG